MNFILTEQIANHHTAQNKASNKLVRRMLKHRMHQKYVGEMGLLLADTWRIRTRTYLTACVRSGLSSYE